MIVGLLKSHSSLISLPYSHSMFLSYRDPVIINQKFGSICNVIFQLQI